MRYTVVGAGAIGGTIGAHLARAGHEVLLVDSALDHVEAIRRAGLTIEGRETFQVRVPAISTDELRRDEAGRPLEAVLLAVKAMHTEAALESIAPLLGADAFVASMQNGLNERVIARRIGPARTVGAFVNFGADYLEPGRILYGGAGALYLGELDGRLTPRLRDLGEALRTSFLPNTTLTDNIWGYLWGKLGYASMLFATALIDETMSGVIGNPRWHPLLANLAGEVVAVADAEGVRSEGFDGYEPGAMRFSASRPWDAIRRSLEHLAEHNRRSLKQKSGIWRDLVVRRRRTEVDTQLGIVAALARERGVATPLNDRLIAMIHELEDGRRSMDPGNLEELARLSGERYPEPRAIA